MAIVSMHNIQPVVLCGGSGTRLWPLSRAGFPKQFLSLNGDQTLFQSAVNRLANLDVVDAVVEAPLILTNEEHRFIVLEQLREIDISPKSLLLEPIGRNTAPALTLAALASREAGDDPILVVTPADQTISDPAAFSQAIQASIQPAVDGDIVILGVMPDRPEVGFGYIQADFDTAEKSTMAGLSLVLRFVEKPDLQTAQLFLDQDDYFWNAGMFVVRASVWLAAIEEFRSDIFHSSAKAWERRSMDQKFLRPGREEFLSIPSDSIDYAVIERCPGSAFRIVMAPLDAGWSDLGSWDAVWKAASKDPRGNAHFGDTLTVDSKNTFVHASSRLVVLVGVDDLVVVETPDALLVTEKSRSQDVRYIVDTLCQQSRQEHILNRKVHRPWGWYDAIDGGERFKVKRIQVKPGARLSLQKHYHRAEHWIIVKGTAEVTCGDKTLLLTENQSTYIPIEEIHRLANPGKIPLEIIEVQSGSYLGEDDIVRLEDSYGR
ncbi:MAG: mannose-1-phosphate guanylyltransferase/mannose-6-phosphate isomerase [Burkholderiales bacterium]|nr:mannose-1-phosphate guanylyltransferase/mannose-6-phosphate isomerase [Burkholderiales bacterium]